MTPSISASAIESFDPALGGCARKWAFGRLDGVPKPQSPGAALGSRCHELWAAYLEHGTPFDLSTVEGRICHATQHLLPAPCGPIDVEFGVDFTWESIRWKGVQDAGFFDHTHPDELWTVLDHKTTSDFRYAKTTREALLGHPQAPLYGVGSFVNPHLIKLGNPDENGVQLAWNYVKHNVVFDKDAPPGPYGYVVKRAHTPKALDPPVRLVVTRAEAEDALGRFVPTAKRMLKIIAEPPTPVVSDDGSSSIARALEPNPDACEAFGGCPYKARCGLTPQDIASRMARSFATSQDSAGMARSFATSQDSAGMAGEQKNMASQSMRDRIGAIAAARRAGESSALQSSAVGALQAAQAEAAAREAKAVASLARAAVAPSSGVIHEARGGIAPAQAPIPEEAKTQARGFGPVNPPEGALVPPPAPEPAPLPPAEAPTKADAPAPKRRGRPPGSRNKVKGGAPVEAVEANDAALIADEESCLAGPSKLDTLPAPSPELLSDDVMAEIVRRVCNKLSTDEVFQNEVRGLVRRALRDL